MHKVGHLKSVTLFVSIWCFYFHIYVVNFTEEHHFRWGVSGFMAAAKGRLQQQSPSCIRILKQIAAHCNALLRISIRIFNKEVRSPLQCIVQRWLQIATILPSFWLLQCCRVSSVYRPDIGTTLKQSSHNDGILLSCSPLHHCHCQLYSRQFWSS